MRRYETIAIIDPDISEDDRTSLLTRIKEIIPQQDGVVVQEDLWGSRKLAYSIKNKPRGYYARYDYCGLGKAVQELERFFRIDDRVLKYLTVQLAPQADVEKIQADIAEAQAEKVSSTKRETVAAPVTKVDTAPAVKTATAPAGDTKAEDTAEAAAETEAPESVNKAEAIKASPEQTPTDDIEKE